jgi:hypothetical protein
VVDGKKTTKKNTQAKHIGGEVHEYGKRQKLSSSLGQRTTLFQAEVYAIKAHVAGNLHGNRNIYILSDSQEAIKVLSTHLIASNCSGTTTNPSCKWLKITE